MNLLRIYIARSVTFIVAMQILNMGFFAQDFQQLSLTDSSLSDHNVINSVVEYVSEVVLEKVNAMPEGNNKSNKDLQAQKHVAVKMIELHQLRIVPPSANVA